MQRESKTVSGSVFKLNYSSSKDLSMAPVINLKKLNNNIPYCHFKMENLSVLKELLQQDDYMCKIDLKDAYFSVALNQKSRKFLRFQWGQEIYKKFRIFCLCFSLGPAPRVFTKIMKVPNALLRRLNVRLKFF